MKRLGGLIGLATELGVTMGLMAAGFVVAGLWVGRRLDVTLGTTPFATILFLIGGAVAGQLALYRLAARAAKRLSAGSAKTLSAPDTWSTLGLALKVLGLIVVPGLLGTALGIWLDRVAGTGILATVVLLLSGLALGLTTAVRLSQKRSSETAAVIEGEESCRQPGE